MTHLIFKGNTVYLNGKKLGVISWREKTFITFRHHDRHWFKKYHAWAVNKDLVDYLKKRGIIWIELHDKYTGNIYRVSIKKILEKGELYQNPKDKDWQLVLPVVHWKTIVTNPEKTRNILRMHGGR